MEARVISPRQQAAMSGLLLGPAALAAKHLEKVLSDVLGMLLGDVGGDSDQSVREDEQAKRKRWLARHGTT